MIEQVSRSLAEIHQASWKPLTHRKTTVPRFEKVVFIALFASLSLSTVAMAQRVGGARVSGCVRDANGVPQRGALVNVLTANAIVRGSAYTDLHGRYAIGRLSPGTYNVRLAAPLHVRAVHAPLKLHAGMRAVVDLTLVTLSDAATWLPAEHRSAEEPSDDWQWTLRSAANRPILRWAGDEVAGGGLSVEQVSAADGKMTRIALSNATGAFGGGPEESVLRSYARKNSSIVRIAINLHEPRSGLTGRSLSSQLTAEVESGPRSISEGRSQLSLESRPEFVAGSQGSGLESVRVGRANRIQLGELVVLDVGSTLDLSHAAAYLASAHPFLRMELRPAGKLKIGYGFANSKDAQSYDDLNILGENGTGVVATGDMLRQASQLRQQVYLEDGDNGNVFRVSYHRTSPGTTVVAGVVSSGPGLPAGASPSLIHVGGLEGIMFDSASATFRTLAGMTSSAGWNVEVARSLAPTLFLQLLYSTGQALVLDGDSSALTASDHVAQVRSRSVTLALKGRIVATNTGLYATYRWQPSRTITAVDPFAQLGDQPYLGLHMRQPLTCWGLLPSGLELTADVTNLLAEGYRPITSNGGQTAFLAQSPRVLSAGVVIDF